MAKVLYDQNYFPVDYKQVMKDYLYEQFKDSPNLIKYLEAILIPFEELQNVFIDILNYREVQNAFGKTLETLGELIGQPRPIYDANSALFFGFVDTGGNPGPIAPLGMGTLTDSSIGGIFRFEGQPQSGLTAVGDSDYRTFIATKIQSNSFEGTTDSLLIAIENFLYSPFASGNDLIAPPDSVNAGVLPFAFDDEGGTSFPEPHDGFGDVTIPGTGGIFGSATVKQRIYVRLTDNYDLGSRGIQLRFYTKLSTKLKSFLKLNNILPKISGIRYTYQDDNGVF